MHKAKTALNSWNWEALNPGHFFSYDYVSTAEILFLGSMFRLIAGGGVCP